MLEIIDGLTSIDVTSNQNQSQILLLLDDFAASLVDSPVNTTNPVTFSGTNIGFTLQTIPRNYNSSLVASIHQEDDRIGVTFSNPETKVSRENTKSIERIKLPRELFNRISDDESTNHQSFNKSRDDELTNHNHVYSYVFKNNGLFNSNNSILSNASEIVNSESKALVPTVDGHVLAITVHGKTIRDLEKPITFTTEVSKENKKGICAYWKVEGRKSQKYTCGGE